MCVGVREKEIEGEGFRNRRCRGGMGRRRKRKGGFGRLEGSLRGGRANGEGVRRGIREDGGRGDLGKGERERERK